MGQRGRKGLFDCRAVFCWARISPIARSTDYIDVIVAARSQNHIRFLARVSARPRPNADALGTVNDRLVADNDPPR
jgi:hypothetical protein